MKSEQLSLFSIPDSPTPSLPVPQEWQKSYMSYTGKFFIIGHRRKSKGSEYTVQYAVVAGDGKQATYCELITRSLADAEADFRDTVDRLKSASTFGSVELSNDLGQLVVPSHFIEESVREQDTQGVRKDSEFTTAQVAPEHFNSAPEHIHWIENYWVKRGNKKHHYYRYCWMTGRKINRIHIGSVTSAIALQKKAAVEIAISDGFSPAQIQELIRSWRQ
jgi:hypothetical protein